jgi:hypothetical protein
MAGCRRPPPHEVVDVKQPVRLFFPVADRSLRTALRADIRFGPLCCRKCIGYNIRLKPHRRLLSSLRLESRGPRVSFDLIYIYSTSPRTSPCPAAPMMSSSYRQRRTFYKPRIPTRSYLKGCMQINQAVFICTVTPRAAVCLLVYTGYSTIGAPE